jgi:hypothetical protein
VLKNACLVKRYLTKEGFFKKIEHCCRLDKGWVYEANETEETSAEWQREGPGSHNQT